MQKKITSFRDSCHIRRQRVQSPTPYGRQLHGPWLRISIENFCILKDQRRLNSRADLSISFSPATSSKLTEPTLFSVSTSSFMHWNSHGFYLEMVRKVLEFGLQVIQELEMLMFILAKVSRQLLFKSFQDASSCHLLDINIKVLYYIIQDNCFAYNKYSLYHKTQLISYVTITNVSRYVDKF